MDNQLRTRLHDFTLTARHTLTAEVLAQLEGLYGLHRNGVLAPADTLPALQSLPDAADTRRQLEQYMADERAARRSPADAVARLVKEAAFTHLNRLVALKMLEARKVVRGTLDKGYQSNDFLFYLNDHPDELARFNQGSMPQDARGEGPADVVYRHFLLAQYARLAEEIRVLFDPDTLLTRLFPRPHILNELLASLNSADFAPAWAAGNEETIGWVYQYFNETEKSEAFERVNKLKAKFEGEDLPAVTQLFTPRWIVTWLVENTLGRLWLQMHPDSRLAERMNYLVPLTETQPSVPLKPLREITMLDPACGTMHFGLVAFDLLVEMYREERERAGDIGWLDTPSITNDDDIGQVILAHNLYGMDIDLRAVQLSALTLYLKAKMLNKTARLTESNLAVTDITLLHGDHLEDFIQSMGFTQAIYPRLIRAVWERLRNGALFGSLLRVDETIRELVELHRRNAQSQLPLFRDKALSGDAYTEGDEFWDVLETQIIQSFDEFARQQAMAGRDEQYFAGEGKKGMRMVDILLRRYDVVVANPPYLDSRDMNDDLKKFLESEYPEGKRNLSAAFQKRCIELALPNGRVGMITPMSFMFLPSYEKVRQYLRDTAVIEALAQTGYHTFESAMVDCAFFTLRRENDTLHRENSTATYFRLVREPDVDAKRIAFEQAVTATRAGQSHPLVYSYRQGDFDAIPDAPWVYWVSAKVQEMFRNSLPLATIAPPRQGLATADNFRFLRYWWEMGKDRVATNCSSISESERRREKWYPYMKGGSFQRWYGNQEYTVNWYKNGGEIRNFGIETGRTFSRPQNTEFYFRRGVTYSDLTQKAFNARLSPGGFIFDVKGSSIFPDDIPLVLGILNSTLANYILNLLNPTVSFQVGDLSRLPIPPHGSDRLRTLVEQAIELAKQDSREDETTYDFVAPPSWASGSSDITARQAQLAQVEADINDEVYRLYGINDNERAAIEAELNQRVLEEDEVAPSATPDEAAVAAPEILDTPTLARRWVSYALGIVLGRFTQALGGGNWDDETAARLAALRDEDGILVLTENHPDSAAAKIRAALDIMLGEHATDAVIQSATGGKALNEWLGKDFYKWHLQQYRKRPVYWLLQSPARKWGVLLFHERATADTLFRLAGNRYAQGALNTLTQQIATLTTTMHAAVGRDQRQLAKDVDILTAQQLDLEAFLKQLDSITHATNTRGEQVGWQPERDDGILLNLAPLHTLIPTWSAEPKKAWHQLERGEFDWSHTAMRYFLDRVRAAAKQNRSYAIAHGF